MNTKQTIRKVLFAALWLVLGGGMIILLVAAIGRKKKEVCSHYQIIIKGRQNNFSAGCCSFIDEKDIVRLVSAATGGEIKGQHLSDIKLRQLEDLLEDNEWIHDAELWMNNKNILNITVTEREPIARVFTTAGNSFYIDAATKRMSLSQKMSARVPVFTGFPEKRIWSEKDSALIRDIKSIAQFVQQNIFWNSQVAQLDIVNCGYNCWQFEMIPVIGNHIAKLGNAENIEEKFGRLFTFYNQVLSKSGFDKYPVIDVQYRGQVVGVREKPAGSIDSVQLRKNVEKLLRQSRQTQIDSAVTINPVKQNTSVSNDSLADVSGNNKGTKRSKPVNLVPVKTANPPVKSTQPSRREG